MGRARLAQRPCARFPSGKRAPRHLPPHPGWKTAGRRWQPSGGGGGGGQAVSALSTLGSLPFGGCFNNAKSPVETRTYTVASRWLARRPARALAIASRAPARTHVDDDDQHRRSFTNCDTPGGRSTGYLWIESIGPPRTVTQQLGGGKVWYYRDVSGKVGMAAATIPHGVATKSDRQRLTGRSCNLATLCIYVALDQCLGEIVGLTGQPTATLQSMVPARPV